MKRYCHFLFKTLIISVLVVLYTACSKTTESIGNGLLSENDHIGASYIDTLQIRCHSERIDTLFSKGLTTVLLGSMMDPVMGLTNANLFTQLHISSTNHYFGDDPVIDSVVLQLAYIGYYGDTTTTQTVHVYELADTLSGYDNYYQFSDVEVKGFDLANNFQFQPRPKTTRIVVGNDTLSQAVLRIPLDNSFGEQLATADSAIFSSIDAFKNYFYGLKICCESVSQNGAICYFNPTSNTVTKLQVYYRETPDANSMRYDFYITSDDAYFNQYLHDYTLGSPEFTQQVLQNDTLMGQTQLYLQSMGGIRSFISFPDLLDWANAMQEDGTHLIINEAKLIIPASSLSLDSIYKAPQAFVLMGFNEDNSTYLLPDYYEGANFFGGSYNTSKESVTFRISEYMQSVIMGKKDDYGLSLGINGGSYNAQRFVINGPEAPEGEKMRLEVTYSIVNE